MQNTDSILFYYKGLISHHVLNYFELSNAVVQFDFFAVFDHSDNIDARLNENTHIQHSSMH